MANGGVGVWSGGNDAPSSAVALRWCAWEHRSQPMQQVTLITAGRLDAVLHEPPPERTKHTIEALRVEGPPPPALEKIPRDPPNSVAEASLDWYVVRGADRGLHRYSAVVPLWMRSLPIRWILTRDPAGKHPRHPPFFPPTLPRQQNRSSLGDAHEALRSGRRRLPREGVLI